ncbi:MAG: histidine kinase, partial [Burkholderiales bacterium]|nr:histidine kinase [Burkholderiales bacterium]
IVPLAAVAGFLLGTALADALLGTDSMAYWHAQPRMAWGFLTLSLVTGAVLTYFAASRAQLAKARERAEAAQRHAAESRLRLLESQLEPHMLFNTLANLRALIGVDPARAQTMLDYLIAYLRATLSASRTGSHTLAQEFDRLRDYLELMAVRMGPRLHYTLELPDTLRQISVPPLLLQPLVENSIQHGLEPQVQGGSISVRAFAAAGVLTLEVADTGKGLDPATSPADGNGFGLRQVRERLATLYGTAAAIEFIADHAGGTRASITIPLKP